MQPLTWLYRERLGRASRERYFAGGIALLMVFIIPVLHFAINKSVWTPNKAAIDKNNCRCGCFDTIMKGSYEDPPSTYKHMYINATSSSAQIWLLIVLGMVGLYEATKYTLRLLLQGKVRISFLVVLLSTLYPHYYAGWNYFNYLNDEFYVQWWHQTFFTVTELVSTLVVLNLCDVDNIPTPLKLLVIITISSLHIFISSSDQFIRNVIRHKGHMYQIARDLGLMSPDLLHLVVSVYTLFAEARRRKTGICTLFTRTELVVSLVSFVFLSAIAKNM